MLQALARNHPLLLVVDDLQWADSGSINLLFHLGRQLSGHRILLVSAFRPGDVAMGRDGENTHLSRSSMSSSANTARCGWICRRSKANTLWRLSWKPEPNRLGMEFRRALFQHTGGHPLFVVELVRGLQERGDLTGMILGHWIEQGRWTGKFLPPRVEAVIAESIGRLPEGCKRLNRRQRRGRDLYCSSRFPSPSTG